jgi:hypothetical protein
VNKARDERNDTENDLDTVIKEICYDSSCTDVGGFKGIVAVKITNEEVSYLCNREMFTERDREILEGKVLSTLGEEYAEGFHRIDLTNTILMARVHATRQVTYVVGHLVEKSPKTRLELIDVKREYLMRRFLSTTAF